MKKITKIRVRAYSMTFDVEVSKKEHLTLQQACEYVRKHIIDTAQVITMTLVHENCETVHENPNYKDPEAFEFEAKRVA